MPPDYPLQVYVFNVGQGDHLLIKLPDGSYGIIDTYYDRKYNPHNEPPGLTYLKKQKAAGEKIRLRFFHLSHFHKDHLKGLKQWTDWIQTNNIQLDYLLLPGTGGTKDFTSMFLSILADSAVMDSVLTTSPELFHTMETFHRNYGASPLHALDGFKKSLKKIALDNKKKKKKPKNKECITTYLNAINRVFLYYNIPVPLKTFCIVPLSDAIIDFAEQGRKNIIKSFFEKKKLKGDRNKNDISTVLLMRYGDQVLTFGGDAEIYNLEKSIDSLTPVIKEAIGGDFKSHFIKLFHHGGSQSSSPKIWEAFLADNSQIHIAISAGINKKYNHPHASTITDIKKQAKKVNSEAHIYATNRDHLKKRGNIKLTPVTDSRVIFNGPSSKKTKKNTKKSSFLDNVPIKQSAKTKARNRANSTINHFLGYCFEFGKSVGDVRVVELRIG